MFQFEKITRLAEVVFQDEGQLSIQGQGVLKNVFLSAYLSENGQRILPPREHIYFNRDLRAAVDFALVRKVATYFLLSEEEAMEQVSVWEHALVERTRNGEVTFGDLGKFSHDGQLDFSAAPLLYYQMLPEVAFKSVGAALHAYPGREVSAVTTPGPKPVRKKILVPALWTVLAVLFGFAIYLWSGPLDAWFTQRTEMDTRLVNVAPKSYKNDTSLDFYNDTDEVEEQDHMRIGEEDEANNIADNIAEKYGPENIESQGSESDAEIGIEKEISRASEVNSLEEDIGVQSRCTLIVGAFANRGNVERMVARLGSYGVEAVTLEGKTLTLVGAAMTCSNEHQMDKLRSEIDPNAWFYEK